MIILKQAVGWTMLAAGLAPILDVLAPPDGWRHFGDAGAGHAGFFVAEVEG